MDADPPGLCVGFVGLVSHDRTRVILPLAAACHSRMLQNLLQAVHLSCVANAPLPPRFLPPPSLHPDEEGEDAFVSFAAAYPSLNGGETHAAPFLNVPLHCMELDTLVRIADFLLRKACEGYVVAKRQRQVQAYQRSREDGGGAPESFQEEPWTPVERGGAVAVLRDLDRTSQVDQLRAIQLLLGSDFLGC
ncbi:unnamed protein product [Phytomonas sp. EM1]|nr:unnamed protein product [Phytomonas sp. EM1]|eukprot:CCW64818.1 unnamed protein product [Phytomonas sp. isolate EM1]